ncbi:hypothetical protein N7520_003420 [Penicillium odoratum]|uniref:uncharacterized protein n=1 Tax=Penicillium odoratum TaxID=1167516 RepID=UPI0025489E6E|nr:uncharacterized protein N7520_003420 [Penicillium odoratum]KAJ5768861.1 hypothetical protein N7520_003420 [Penicillium odoratum]
MKSFSSSAINKSGKKFAPKAPVRRAPAAPARRPSAIQQAQAQAAQASQAAAQDKEKSNATSAVTPVPPPSVSPAAPEQATVETPFTASQPAETVQSVPKPATSISIPRPKNKAPQVATPITTPVQTPDLTPAFAAPTPPSTADGSTSPRTLTSEHIIVQSIENDVEHAVASRVALEAARSTDSETVGPSTQDSGAEPQEQRRISLKGARKTSEITKSRAQPRPRGPIVTPPTTQRTSETPVTSVAPSLALSTPDPSQASAKGKRKASKAGTSDVDGSEKPKKIRRRKREVTPEGADTVEILPNVIKMSELCKDLKTGKKSNREIALRRIELEEHERKLKAKDGTPGTPGTPGASKAGEASKEKADPPGASERANGPVMRIVNGEIVLDAASLQVDRHADAARDAGDMDVVEENQLTRKINQATYGKRSKTETWDEEMTDLFYRGLRMFGTDFMVISKLFPGRSRRQIKLKFNNEERKDPQRIKDTLLGPSEAIDIQEYSLMTNKTYDDPKLIQKELDEEKAKIEEQHEKEKKLQEDMIRNPTAGADGDAADAKANSAPTKGKGRNNKKQIKNAGGGTEEVLGSIDG